MGSPAVIASQDFDLPAAARWLWRTSGGLVNQVIDRVENGQGIAPDLTIWHELSPESVRLLPTEDGLAAIDVDGKGGYLSLVTQLSAQAVDGITREDILGCLVRLSLRTPVPVYLRLNIAQGCETVPILRQLRMPLGDAVQRVEFDLAYAKLLHRPVDRVWLDLIFEAPGPNHLRIGGLLPYRRPRAQM
jgi:hypothetical protein